MLRIPQSAESLKSLVKTSVKDILYQWIVSSRFKMSRDSIPQMITNENWMPVNQKNKNSRSADTELSWLVQQHIDFLKDIPYEV